MSRPTQSSPAAPLTLERIPGRLAVCRLDPHESVPAWANQRARPSSTPSLLCITHTDRELSIVIDESLVPPGVKAERGFVAFRIAGVVPFGCVGILSRLTGALADAGVSVFAISTFDTDYLLVKAENESGAVAALRKIAVVQSPGKAGG